MKNFKRALKITLLITFLAVIIEGLRAEYRNYRINLLLDDDEFGPYDDLFEDTDDSMGRHSTKKTKYFTVPHKSERCNTKESE